MTFQRGTQYGLESDPADDWRKQAACHDGDDPEVWFPPEGNNGHDAKRICRRCTVRRDCLEGALAVEGGLSAQNRYGVWGGRSPRERAQIAKCRAGKCGHPEHRADDEYGRRVAQVRELAGQGLTDYEIGKVIGRSRERVYELRRAHGIAAGYRLRGSNGSSA